MATNKKSRLEALNSWLDERPVLGILDKLGKLSILVAVISAAWTFQEQTENTRKARHYQAWQVINSATGKEGPAGRIDALQDLVGDKVPLFWVNFSEYFRIFLMFFSSGLSTVDS